MKRSYDRSKSLFENAQQYIPGGVNSPVRAFKSVGGTPLFIKKASGAYLFDEDGNQYIDFINSWGPMVMGHAYPPVVEAIQKKAGDSTSFGAPTSLEIEIASLIHHMVPGIDLIRMVNSGTEACMSAIRLARGYTSRNKVIKFEGCYHGHADAFLSGAGSGMATLEIQATPGVPSAVTQDIITLSFNDLEAVRQTVKENPDTIACIILEPVAGNMGCIPPAPDFLNGLRSICDDAGIVLIFDEVMTGFRLNAGGAQQLYQIDADLVTFGKIIGGGLPVGAFGGKHDIMKLIAPLGNVYQAGTLSGNPLAMIAGFTLLNQLHLNSDIYSKLEKTCNTLCNGIHQILTKKGVPHKINHVGSMMSVHFTSGEVTNFRDAKACDLALFNKFFHHMLANGVYLPPSAFETWFISHAISTTEIDITLKAVESFEA